PVGIVAGRRRQVVLGVVVVADPEVRLVVGADGRKSAAGVGRVVVWVAVGRGRTVAGEGAGRGPVHPGQRLVDGTLDLGVVEVGVDAVRGVEPGPVPGALAGRPVQAGVEVEDAREVDQ